MCGSETHKRNPKPENLAILSKDNCWYKLGINRWIEYYKLTRTCYNIRLVYGCLGMALSRVRTALALVLGCGIMNGYFALDGDPYPYRPPVDHIPSGFFDLLLGPEYG